MTNKITILSVFLFWFASVAPCENISIQNKLKKVNYIEIRFFNGKEMKVYKSDKKMDLLFLKELITKANNNTALKCDTTGEIIYFKNKVQVFKAYFCTKATGSKYDGAVTFRANNQKVISLLNYGSGMLIDEMYYQLQK
jgi:hypothetical protein